MSVDVWKPDDEKCMNLAMNEYNYIWLSEKKHKAKQIYDTNTWKKFYLVTSCIVVYNIAEEKTNITLMLSQSVPSP
jgi:hypothetical protein